MRYWHECPPGDGGNPALQMEVYESCALSVAAAGSLVLLATTQWPDFVMILSSECKGRDELIESIDMAGCRAGGIMNRKNRKQLAMSYPLLAVAFLFALGGCAVTAEQCDPRNADMGLGTKLGCSTRGVYAERVTQKERVLLDEQKANQLFRSVYAALQQEQREVGQQRSQQQKQYAELSRSLDALLREIKSKAAGNQQIQQQIAALEKQIETLKQQESPSVLQRRHELQKLQEQIAVLEADLGLR